MMKYFITLVALQVYLGDVNNGQRRFLYSVIELMLLHDIKRHSFPEWKTLGDSNWLIQTRGSRQMNNSSCTMNSADLQQ